MARLYRRGRIYWLRWSQQGQRHYRSLRTANRRVALHKKAVLEQQLLAHRKLTQDGDATFQQAITAYLLACQTRKTPHSHLTDALRLKKVGEQLGTVRLSQLTPAALEQFLAGLTFLSQRDRRPLPVTPSTRNHYLKLLRAFGAWCVERGYLFENPTKGIVRLPIVKVARVWLTQTQRGTFLTLARTKSPHHYPMIATALYAGLRYGELKRLEWADVDFDRDIIQVRPKADWAPKSKKGRVVPLHPELKKILRAHKTRAAGSVCFTTPVNSIAVDPHQPYQTEPRPQILRRLFKAVGLEGKGLGFHTLRHSFASNLVQSGVSVYKVCDWLGHADVRTTQIYAHLVQGFDPEITKL